MLAPKASAPPPPADIVSKKNHPPDPALSTAFRGLPTSDLLRLSVGCHSAIAARLSYDGCTVSAIPSVSASAGLRGQGAARSGGPGPGHCP